MNNDKKNDSKLPELQGNALTHEQLSDVYAAGTSDGIHQLADRKINITNKSLNDLQK